MNVMLLLEILTRADVSTSNVLGSVLHVLATEETIPNLPPGGGLSSKYGNLSNIRLTVVCSMACIGWLKVVLCSLVVCRRSKIEQILSKLSPVKSGELDSPQHTAMVVE